ncbi:MAG TPA: sigma-70 family RNA polymerase sigma factor [Kofleriaceae bacterium]|nr:sigma-70 family RNA polymerase sigma factor [Kofleriaceae bacterium]
MTQTHAAVAKARDEFLAMVASIRPELHRYCARLTGSVIDGEDIVQDTLARAFYALGQIDEPPPLRPWLFRIAHNAAVDFLKSHGKKLTEPRADLAEVVEVDEQPDPFATRVALARFLALPVIQRSAVILKDVLGHSLEETAAAMDTTVMAVKAALVRGRAKLREAAVEQAPAQQVGRAELDRYATLFNAGDWDGVRAMISEDCRLDLVSKAQRRGKAVGAYFTRYAAERVTLRVVELEGRLALAAHVAGAARPSYFILLDFADGRVAAIRDFRYVPYVAAEAEPAG